MSNDVDPKHFRKRFFAAMSMYWDAVERQKQAELELADAFKIFSAIAGRGITYAIQQLASEPRTVCVACHVDFMTSDTCRDVCGDCLRSQRDASLRGEA
jgi:hypothetical protein